MERKQRFKFITIVNTFLDNNKRKFNELVGDLKQKEVQPLLEYADKERGINISLFKNWIESIY